VSCRCRALASGNTVEAIGRDAAKAAALASALGGGATVGAFGSAPVGDPAHTGLVTPDGSAWRHRPTARPVCVSQVPIQHQWAS
jgi:hypothetical protein